MAGFDYARTRSSADSLIERFGQAAELKRAGEATGPKYDPTPGAPETFPVRIVVQDYTAREIDGERVLRDDKKVLLAAGGLPIVPTMSDTLSIGGVSHSIIRVTPTAPAGVAVMYEIQARR